MEIFVEKRRRAVVHTFEPGAPWTGPGKIYKAPDSDDYIFVDPRNNLPKPIAPGMVAVVTGVRVEIMTRAALDKDWEPDTSNPGGP